MGEGYGRQVTRTLARAVIAFQLTASCASPVPATSEADAIEVIDGSGGTWSTAPAGEDEIALRFRDTPHGVRVGTTAPWAVSLVVDGHTVSEPVFRIPDALPPPERVELSVEGHDLLVRFSGVPLSTLLPDDPNAPDDPVLTWLRLRPRNGSWRLVSDGLVTVQLRASSVAPGPDGSVQIDGPDGRWVLNSDAPATTSRFTGGRWVFDTAPSLYAQQPYPRTGITFTPSPSPR